MVGCSLASLAFVGASLCAKGGSCLVDQEGLELERGMGQVRFGVGEAQRLTGLVVF